MRTLASLSYVVASVASTGIVLYAPCLSLRTVTGLPLVGLVLMGGLIGTFYTVLVSVQCFLTKKQADFIDNQDFKWQRVVSLSFTEMVKTLCD